MPLTLTSIDKSIRRTFTVILGSIEVALGIAQIAEGLRALNWGAMQEGLGVVGRGLRSVEDGVERDGESWGTIGVQIRHLVWMWISIRMRRDGFFEPLRRLVEQPGGA